MWLVGVPLPIVLVSCEFLRVSPEALRERLLADEEPRQVQQAA
jgi:hypothetical protein